MDFPNGHFCALQLVALTGEVVRLFMLYARTAPGVFDGPAARHFPNRSRGRALDSCQPWDRLQNGNQGSGNCCL